MKKQFPEIVKKKLKSKRSEFVLTGRKDSSSFVPVFDYMRVFTTVKTLD